jgi:preprotein translocase subunit SecG
MGAAFGGGGGNNVFGARGAGNLLTKLTGASAVIFFLTSFTLSIMSSKTGSVVQGVGSGSPSAASAPAAAAPSEGAAPADAAPAPAPTGDAAQKPQE